jgi:predicted ATPase/class 3 adenylate cyclase
MSALPTGTVTFLFTDVEGSSRLWEQYPEAMKAALARHDELLREAVEAHHGWVVKTTGDGVHAAFGSARDAVQAAIVAQQQLAMTKWEFSEPLRVRMGVHTGETESRDGDYFGSAVNRAARLMSVAHGGQVVASATSATLVEAAGFDLVDLGEHRLAGLSRAERVWQVCAPGLAREFPPLRSPDALRHNLPMQLSPLFGRRREIADVVDRLAGERLVTLTGSGGVGKTRLALAVGAEVLAAFPGGVWFVELASASGAGAVGRATLSALGKTETPGVAPAEVAAVELGDTHRSLVMLDNCEHLVGECAGFVSTVLQRNPAVSVLATSREQLGVDGEIAWRVPSLSSPPIDELPTVGALAGYDAVSLFVDRARRARSAFVVNDANAPAVAQICQRLDGIPLAVELAAARCRHLSAEQIAAELDDRFRLLTGGPRVALPRQQTLAASVEWSFDLLDEVERRVLRRLGVFAGAFSLDGAEAIAAAIGDVNPIVVFDTIGDLVDKSLVLAEESDHAAHYRLLETIRAFAVNRAREAGELDELRDAHAAWWSERVDALGVTGPTDDVIATVDVHHEDLITALSWAADRDIELGLRLLWPLARAFQGTGRAGDAMSACDQLLSPEVENRFPTLWLRAATSAAIPILSFRGPHAFTELLARCESRAIELNDHYQLALSRWLRGMSLNTTRELARQADQHHQPYALALATVRLAIDTPLDEPSSALDALHRADDMATSYDSQYIRHYAQVAHAHHGLVFGDLSVALAVGQQLLTTTTRPMQDNGFWYVALAGLLLRDDNAVNVALDAAQRGLARQVPGAIEQVNVATYILDLLRGDQREPRPKTTIDDPWLGPRDRVDRGDLTAARSAIKSLDAGGATRQAMARAVSGLVDHSENHWRDALQLADQHGLRLIAVDALEGVAAAAAASNNFTEALQLLAAADRLRGETGYQWRFPGEQRTYDQTRRAARDSLGQAAAKTWQQGRMFTWHEAAEYAQRARDERGRPHRPQVSDID